MSISRDNAYDLKSGISMATLHAAGSVAHLMGNEPGLTNDEVKWRILNGIDYKGLPVLTGGKLNIYKSLTLPAPVVTIDVTPTRKSRFLNRG